MALKIKALQAGSVTATGTTELFKAFDTLGQQKAAIVGSVHIHYSHTSSLTIKVWVKSGSTTGQIYQTVTGVGPIQISVLDKITLAPGEKIEINVSAAPYTGGLTYCVSGFERDTGT